jgi:transcription elongation factor Elf1
MTIDWMELDWRCPYCGSEDMESDSVITKKNSIAVITCGDCGCHYLIFNEELEYKVQENKLDGFPCQEYYDKPSKREEREMYEEREWDRKRDEGLI